MRKCISILFAILLSNVFAIAEMDFSSMTFEEMMTLNETLHKAMIQNEEWQEVVVPVGTYKVGEHIPAGKWIIKTVSDDISSISIGKRLRDDGRSIKTDADSCYFTVYSTNSKKYKDGLPTFICHDFKTGTFVEIKYYAVTFTKYTGPSDLGLSFK